MILVFEINFIMDIKSPYKKWIKSINQDETILFDDYNRKDYFKKVADICLDNDKLRKTLIKFIPIIDDFKEKKEWIYIFLINKRIVKIGGTRTGLYGRCSSYLCGHHIQERGKSGDCSKTNAYIYNTFEYYLELGYYIEMFAYELPKIIMNIDIFDKKIDIAVQTYHAYETTFMKDYKDNYKSYPILNDNCDPDYR